MNYDNITYPLDRIYSKATGVSYPVCGAQPSNVQPEPTPDPEPTSIYGDLVIEAYSGSGNYGFTASMQCTQAMPDKIYRFYYVGGDNNNFELFLIPDSEDNTKLVLDQNNDSQTLEVNPGDSGVVEEADIIDPSTWDYEQQITDTINWSYVGL